jgi:uncharacterized protein (TIRG00374 family)
LNKGKYLGYIVSLAVIIFIVFTFDWAKVAAEFKHFYYPYLLPALALYLMSFVFRAIRWQYMLAPLKQVGFSSSFVVIMIGWMANNILPLRLGEFVRAWAIKRKEGVGASAGFATIVIERVYDGLTLVGLFAFMLVFFETTKKVEICGLVGAGVFLFVLGLLLYTVFREERARRVIVKMIGLFPGKLRGRTGSIVDSFIAGLRFLSSGRQQAIVIFYSFLVWVLEGSVFWIIMRGFDLELPAYSALFALVIVNIVIMLPAMPGYVGTYEAAGILALAPFGIDASVAGSFVIVVHALQYVSVTALGLYFMNVTGWHLKDIEAVEKV